MIAKLIRIQAYFILIIVTLLYSACSYSNVRLIDYSQIHCNDIDKWMNSLKQEMREGYKQDEYKDIKRAERAIKSRHQQCLRNQRLGQKHNVQPDSLSKKQTHLQPNLRSRKYNQPNRNKFKTTDSQFTASNHVYDHKKAKAWDSYFQLEPRCRQQKQTQSDFIYCAYSKKQQRKQFELIWQQQLNTN